MLKNRFKIGINLAIIIVIFLGCSNQTDTKTIEKTETKKSSKKTEKQKIIDNIEKNFEYQISKLYTEGYINKNRVIKFSDNIKSWVDIDTFLVWEVKTKQNINDDYNWKDAKKYCSDLVLDGYSDWRLPNIDELRTLLSENEYNDLYIKKPLSVNTKYTYWSATTYEYNIGNAWYINFYYIFDSYYDKTNSFYVRCVRVGKE